jgi:hypothetical protein
MQLQMQSYYRHSILRMQTIRVGLICVVGPAVCANEGALTEGSSVKRLVGAGPSPERIPTL